jgi:colicin import membrane protein
VKEAQKSKTRPSVSKAIESGSGLEPGKRGRRSMPAVRQARRQYAKAMREVAGLEKQGRQQALELVSALDRKSAAAIRARIKVTSSLLKKAKQTQKAVTTELRRVLAVEAAKSRESVQARAVGLYKAKLEAKLKKDMEKAVNRFASIWKKKRNKIISRRLVAKVKKEAAKAAAARRKANAKARESVKRAETLAKARARKAMAKARAKAKKLAAKVKARTRRVGRKAARKARLVAVNTRRVSRKKRST